jgi:hypothetical protein
MRQNVVERIAVMFRSVLTSEALAAGQKTATWLLPETVG